MTVFSRVRIHASAPVTADGIGPSTVAPDISANRVAFHSFVQKLRAPTTHSSLIAWSAPGFARCSSDSRTASAPYATLHSSGSTTLPRDFDIFVPDEARTNPRSTPA